MIMKKINDRVYEFFNVDYDDYNRDEVESVIEKEEEDDDFSWLDESLDNANFDFLFEEDYEDDDIIVESKPKSKRDEIVDSLNYLKSKDVKTKQDRESIYTLEMVLKNMK